LVAGLGFEPWNTGLRFSLTFQLNSYREEWELILIRESMDSSAFGGPNVKKVFEGLE